MCYHSAAVKFCISYKNMSKIITTESFIERARKVHGDLFDYSEVNYTGARTKVKIRCEKHNDVFEQVPDNHLSGKGCKICAIERVIVALISNDEKFIEKAKTIHGDRYDYSEVNYTGAHTKVKIRCKEHGVFEQTPDSHSRGSGCRTCYLENAHPKIYYSVPTTLYYLKLTDLNGTEYWKIGITTTTMKVRLSRMRRKQFLENFEVLWTKLYDTGKKAWDEEQDILDKYEDYRAYERNISVLKNGYGWTELFTENVLRDIVV